MSSHLISMCVHQCACCLNSQHNPCAFRRRPHYDTISDSDTQQWHLRGKNCDTNYSLESQNHWKWRDELFMKQQRYVYIYLYIYSILQTIIMIAFKHCKCPVGLFVEKPTVVKVLNYPLWQLRAEGAACRETHASDRHHCVDFLEQISHNTMLEEWPCWASTLISTSIYPLW